MEEFGDLNHPNPAFEIPPKGGNGWLLIIIFVLFCWLYFKAYTS